MIVDTILLKVIWRNTSLQCRIKFFTKTDKNAFVYSIFLIFTRFCKIKPNLTCFVSNFDFSVPKIPVFIYDKQNLKVPWSPLLLISIAVVKISDQLERK